MTTAACAPSSRFLRRASAAGVVSSGQQLLDRIPGQNLFRREPWRQAWVMHRPAAPASPYG